MAESAGRKIVKANPHNTSQICSECDELREPKLKLGQKIFNCFKCGFKLNRDVNAARNILKKYLRTEGRGTSLVGAVSIDAVQNLNSQPRSPHPQTR
jgi:putative transposase